MTPKTNNDRRPRFGSGFFDLSLLSATAGGRSFHPADARVYFNRGARVFPVLGNVANNSDFKLPPRDSHFRSDGSTFKNVAVGQSKRPSEHLIPRRRPSLLMRLASVGVGVLSYLGWGAVIALLMLGAAIA